MNEARRHHAGFHPGVHGRLSPRKVDDYETLLTDNRIWKQRTVGIGVVSPERAMAAWLLRSDAARFGH
jgi:NADH:ubiquinone oxidoreductase subunit D